MDVLRPVTFSVNIEMYVVIPAIFFPFGVYVCAIDSLLIYICLSAYFLWFNHSYPFVAMFIFICV
jgi:hypothetical protein